VAELSCPIVWIHTEMVFVTVSDGVKHSQECACPNNGVWCPNDDSSCGIVGM